MANQRKKLEFKSSFGDSGRSPKRPKLEVFQRPSTSTAKYESPENMDENDDLWGDELGDDVVEEALLLESQASTLQVQPPKPESCQNVASGVFKPKTAIISSSRHISSKDPSPRNILKDTGSDTTVKETVVPVLRTTQSLRVEKVKSNVIGKGFGRSNSSPSFAFPWSSSIASAKPGSEVKDSSRKKRFLSSEESENQPAGSSNETNDDQDEKCKELEKLKLEDFSKTGEAALLRQKIKDADLELEKEKLEREKMIEKINQKHLEEMAVLKRQLEAAKAELEFKDRDVGNAVEKCKLLEAGNIVVRPLELKVHSPVASCSSSNIHSRSALEQEFKRKLNIGCKKAPEATHPRLEEHRPEKKEHQEDEESDTQKEEFDKPIYFRTRTRCSEGRMLSSLLVPYWFDNADGATEELFESKWEGVQAVTALLREDIFKGYNLDRLIKWLWNRMLQFLSILRKRSEDDYKFHELRAINLKKYREWCLDRRIPLPQERETKNEYHEEDWFCNFAEQSLDDPLKWLLNYRPWCPKEAFPEIRRTLALCVALMEVSRKTAAIFATHNSCKGYDYCYQCGDAYECEEPDKFTNYDDDSESANDTDDEADRVFVRLYRESLNKSPPCKNELLYRVGPEKDQDPSSCNKVPETSKEISSKDDDNLVSNAKVPKIEEINTKNDHNPPVSSELCKASICTDSKKTDVVDDDSSSDSSQHSEIPHRPIIEIPDDKFLEVNMDTSDILEYDFVHLAHQICKTIGGMKRFSPFEGILGAVLSFLSYISDRVEWSYRGMLLVSAVIKKILFVRPRLRILIHLLDLLVNTGIYPLIMQRLCVNSAWNSAYKDRWKSVWMFTPKVCPLQILLVVMENVTRRKDLKNCSKVLWLEYRTRVFLTFNQWLHAVTEQPGHLVDWLCYALHDDSVEESSEDEASAPCRKRKSGSNAERKDVTDAGRESEKDDAKGVKESEKDENAGEHKQEQEKDDVAESMKEPDRKENESNSATAKENMECEEENVKAEVKKKETKEADKEEEEEEDDDDDDDDNNDDIPIKTVYESSSDSLMDSDDDGNVEVKEEHERCCCRRWLINVLVYILSAVFSDYEEIIKSDPSEYDCMLNVKRFVWKKYEQNPISALYDTHKGKLKLDCFISEQTECLQLGIFMLRELLQRGHPELSIPGGKGFLWDHYTVKGTILHNGQIVTKDYTYKSVPGGPISGAYGSLLHDLELEMKRRKMKFRPDAVKALDELLEARNSWQAKLSADEPAEDEEFWWDMIEKVTCVPTQKAHDDPEIDRQYHIALAKQLNIDLSTREFF